MSGILAGITNLNCFWTFKGIELGLHGIDRSEVDIITVMPGR